MIERHKLSDGRVRYSVRIMRYGKRRVLGRFDHIGSAIDCEVEEYRKYLERVWVDGKEKSHRENYYSSGNHRRGTYTAIPQLLRDKWDGLAEATHRDRNGVCQ